MPDEYGPPYTPDEYTDVEGGVLSDADRQQLMELLSKSNLPTDIVDMIISRLDSPSPEGIGLEEAGLRRFLSNQRKTFPLRMK